MRNGAVRLNIISARPVPRIFIGDLLLRLLSSPPRSRVSDDGFWIYQKYIFKFCRIIRRLSFYLPAKPRLSIQFGGGERGGRGVEAADIAGRWNVISPWRSGTGKFRSPLRRWLEPGQKFFRFSEAWNASRRRPFLRVLFARIGQPLIITGGWKIPANCSRSRSPRAVCNERKGLG